MLEDRLIGMRVKNYNRNAIGEIKGMREGYITVDYHGEVCEHAFPSSLASFLELEDEDAQKKLQYAGIKESFEEFKTRYKIAINSEINYLKTTGGSKKRIVDGELVSSKNGDYLYAFDSDSDLHFPDNTAVRLWFPDSIVLGYIVSCEDFTVLIRTKEYLGESVASVEFTSEQWQLLESLTERLYEMEPESSSLAYQVACCGRRQIIESNTVRCGQNAAFSRATSERITFIWGPPGTGKTETLANIALDFIEKGKRVLMLSYSNVSVDGALLRVSKKADLPDGTIIRYGYPRTKELLESKTLTSYQFVLRRNQEKAEEYSELIDRKKKLKRKDPERAEINKKLNRIREYFLEQEKDLIQNASFVATTVSKATMDRAVYTQKFDTVIFDEASMAYVPQIVFSAGLARESFICMGDFCQLPAIVQSNSADILSTDIFAHTGITYAVENDKGHEWLVMLDEQFRMHHEIADFVSEHMYGDRLRTSDRITASSNEIAASRPCPHKAMSLVDLSGMYSVCVKTMDGSRINIMSALMCLRLAEKNIRQFEVGIITPYNAQSRLILAMIRDVQEKDEKWRSVSCATVHQFQGSEKPIIIYDAVDCFRMTYPGTLLTSLKNDTANRLFNVALTRAKGKFVLVANIDYLERKNISKKLIFTKAINAIEKNNDVVDGLRVLDEMMPGESEKPLVYIEDRKRSWDLYLEDIENARKSVSIDIPDMIDENDEALENLAQILERKNSSGVSVTIRSPEEIDLPPVIQKYSVKYGYVTNPVTVVDGRIVWFGHPLYNADFITESGIIETETFPCIRFEGAHTARSVQTFLEM